MVSLSMRGLIFIPPGPYCMKWRSIERYSRPRQASQVITAILHQSPPSPRAGNPLISSALDSIVLKCLDKDPAQRYQSAKELLVDLKRITTRSVSAPVLRAQPHGSWWGLSLIVLGIALLAVLASVMKRPQFLDAFLQRMDNHRKCNRWRYYLLKIFRVMLTKSISLRA